MRRSNYLLISPTLFEIAPLLASLPIKKMNENSFICGEWDILIGGTGSFPFTYHLMRYLALRGDAPTKSVLVGVAGSYTSELHLSSLCTVREEIWCDVGAEEKDGTILGMDSLNLWTSENDPKPDSIRAKSSWSLYTELPSVKSITVNVAAGCHDTIDFRKRKHQPDIENMEGAAFFKICQLHSIECAQIRSISNYVEPRDRSKWDLQGAIHTLNDKILTLIKSN
jgi:futalosine hydrolase